MINFEPIKIRITMIGNLLKKIFGDKNAKDQKLYEPFSIAANEFQLSLKSISDDELRGKTFAFQQLISEEKQSLEDEMKALEIKAADSSTDIDEKEE
jgi:preprotein translocase subunit SecA